MVNILRETTLDESVKEKVLIHRVEFLAMGSNKPELLKAPPKPYGKIALSLSNCLLPEEKLNPTPSMIDGLDYEVETDLRIIGCELIQTAGILLKLPQVSFSKHDDLSVF